MASPGNPRSKGQLAVENLLLYGIVISAVVIGLIILWQSGILKQVFGREHYVGFSQLVPEDWVVSISNLVFLRFKNTGDSSAIVHLEGVNVTVGGVQCSLGPGEPKLMEPSRKRTFNFTCEGPPRISEEYEIGDEVTVTVSINYTNVDSNETHMSVGQVYTFVEAGDAGAWIDIDTTTTSLPEPYCFEHECYKPGEMDEVNCGDIVWSEECVYCRKDLEVCWYNGACGKTCSIDMECEDYPTDPYLREINRCRKCIEFPAASGNFTCQEDKNEPEPECGPCPSEDWGKFDSTWCDVKECPYCYREWVQLSLTPGDGYYSFACKENESCGESCLDYGIDIYEDCEMRCTHCEPDTGTPDPTDGICKQGDCGRRCGPDAPIEECELGCAWCNITTFECEMGDCGALCGPSNPAKECELGCDVCYGPNRYSEYKCVKADIGVEIYVHNETVDGGKIVDISSPIYVDVSGSCNDGISMLIVSNSTSLSGLAGMGIGDCYELATEINEDFPDGIEDPFSTDFQSYLSGNWSLGWWGTHPCGGAPSCWNQWVTSEDDYDTYCYIAMAQKTGSGRWSTVVADYIQVGFIEVILVYPRPE